MNGKAACVLAAVLLAHQIQFAVAEASPAPAPTPALSPEAVKTELEQELAALGVPTSELAGKLLPGANLVQINSVLNSILTTRLAEAYQKSASEVSQNTQAVLVALANPSAAPALSPSAKTQYEAVMDLYKNPTVANPPAATASVGRKLLVEA